MMRTPFASLLFVGLAVACGTDAAGNDPHDAGAGGVASGGMSSGGRGGEVDAGPATKAGAIIVMSQATPVATVFNNVVSAGFFDGPGVGLPAGCTWEIFGDCRVLLCDFADGGNQTSP